MKSLLFALLLTIAAAADASVSVFTCYSYQSSPTPQQVWLSGYTQVTGDIVDMAYFLNVTSNTHQFAPLPAKNSGYGPVEPLKQGQTVLGWSLQIHKTCPQDPYDWQTTGSLEFRNQPGTYYNPAGPERTMFFACLS